MPEAIRSLTTVFLLASVNLVTARLEGAFFHFTRTSTLQATHSKHRPCSRTANPSVTLVTAKCKLLRGFQSQIYTRCLHVRIDGT